MTALWVGGAARHGLHLWTVWNLMAAGAVAVAAVGIVRRSLLAQVFARGVAVWVVALALPPWSGSSWLGLRLLTAALSLAALRLAAPNLHTDAARAEFAPVAYRRVFLAGATAAVALGVSSAFGALWQAAWMLEGHASGAPGEVWGPAMLAVPCLMSAFGVVRMRAWGVLLGAATAVGSLLCALPVLHQVSIVGLAYACLPGVLLAAPIAASRLAKRAPRARVESADVCRVGVGERAEGDLELVEEPIDRVGREERGSERRLHVA